VPDQKAPDPGGKQSILRKPGLARLAASVLATGIGVLVLWQAGVLFQPEDEVTTPTVSLQAANTGLTTATSGSLSVGIEEGQLAPDFEFSAFDGRRLRLSEFRGRPVLLNFWATWCGPCRIELPDMQELLRKYEGQGFVIIAVNKGEKFAPADRFLKRLKVELTAFGYDPEQGVANRYGVQGLPHSYFIDSRGVIVRVITGQLTKTLMESGAREALAGR
jgi:thiol-disulfide isomerase/thioredoxin